MSARVSLETGVSEVQKFLVLLGATSIILNFVFGFSLSGISACSFCILNCPQKISVCVSVNKLDTTVLTFFSYELRSRRPATRVCRALSPEVSPETGVSDGVSQSSFSLRREILGTLDT